MSILEMDQKPAPCRVVCAVLTASNDVHSMQDDENGSIIVHALETAGHDISEYDVLSGDPVLINGRIRQLMHDDFIELICVTGPNGFSARQTVVEEVVEHFVEEPLDGFSELYRLLMYEQIGAKAMFSRAFGGLGHGRLLFALPGTKDAVRLAMDKLIVPSLREMLQLRQPDP